MTLQTSHKGS